MKSIPPNKTVDPQPRQLVGPVALIAAVAALGIVEQAWFSPQKAPASKRAQAKVDARRI